MRNFIVVLTENQPPVSSGTQLDMPGFNRCGQYSGTPQDYEVATIQCADGVVGRYLYIYIPHSEYLQFCEVEVYAPGEDFLAGTKLSMLPAIVRSMV